MQAEWDKYLSIMPAVHSRRVRSARFWDCASATFYILAVSSQTWGEGIHTRIRIR